jgi:RNA polymerase sigma-70 factor, ECF subfamily
VVSRTQLWAQVRMAWSVLSGQVAHEVHAGRERIEVAPAPDVAPEAGGAIAAEGFAEEALPWIDAVHAFALRLTGGDRDAAEDLVQDTFVRALRFWHTFERGTQVRSWLFTICRNTFLHGRDSARSRREKPLADMDPRAEALVGIRSLGRPAPDPEEEFFSRLIHDEVVDAIDALPPDFRDVLVLSDLGDLNYAEIATILEIPVGTVKSRLFRARRQLQERLREFAVREGYADVPEEA